MGIERPPVEAQLPGSNGLLLCPRWSLLCLFSDPLPALLLHCSQEPDPCFPRPPCHRALGQPALAHRRPGRGTGGWRKGETGTFLTLPSARGQLRAFSVALLPLGLLGNPRLAHPSPGPPPWLTSWLPHGDGLPSSLGKRELG